MKTFTVILAATACLACAATAATDAPKPTFGAWGVDLTGMDTSVKPGDDFFNYANGTWYKNAVIPPDRSSTGSFQDLQILSEQRMGAIVADLKAKPYASLSDEEKKLRDLYDAFTDTTQIEKRGLAPAKKDLAAIARIKTLDDVARAMGTPALPLDTPFAAFPGANVKNPSQYAIFVSQSGLGLPDRDYYLKDDASLAATRDAYRKYLATMLSLAGDKDSDKRGAAVFDLETAMAKSHWAAAERRNVDKTYNPMTEAQLAAFAPGFPWATFFGAEGITPRGPNGDRVLIVRENTAFPAIARTFAETPVAVWRDYLTVRYLHNMSDYLPKAFDDADFDFYGKVLGGQTQQLPRATRGVHLLDQKLGHPLGKLYVARYFPPESKAKVEALVANLLKAYDADIRKIDWMTDATKQKALEKLHQFTPHVGYPDKWRDYSALVIKRNDLIGDVERSRVFEWRYRIDRIDQPVDRNEWNMTPPTINAYYTPVLNSIFFPAAILQAPFFDPNADDAVNYGGIGVVMGHEIGHGFDDQGSKYTGLGVLESWWTDEDRANFEKRVAALGGQFDTYEELPGLFVNGKLTMGENIGDLSGLSIALQAYHFSLGDKPAPVLDGFTGDQRYFLAFAQIWRGKYREGATRQQILANPHSPPHWRVDGPTRNVDAWYTAFDVKPGDKYYLPPDQRVHIW
ncbi:MAG TPA: M13-type metalloendopeptidase [Rhizomicrobium sp.]|jgi:putative endopeptidase|nr:M13-type metalloendopeptidase [Rhizomicrobium sp.]